MFQAYNDFKTTLETISNILNDNNITWCIGASSSLFVQGVAVEPKDLDIIVDVKQFDQAYSLLKEFSPSAREEGKFGNETYYKAELSQAKFPSEIVGFELNTDTLDEHKWEGIRMIVHPLSYELEMYKTRRGKEHIVSLIENVLGKA